MSSVKNDEMLKRNTEVFLDILSNTPVKKENVQEVYDWIKEEIEKNEDLYILCTSEKCKNEVKELLKLQFLFERMFDIWLEYNKNDEELIMSHRLSKQIGDINFEEKLLRDLRTRFGSVKNIDSEICNIDEILSEEKSLLEESKSEINKNYSYIKKLKNVFVACNESTKGYLELSKLGSNNKEQYNLIINEANEIIDKYKILLEETQDRIKEYEGIIENVKKRIKTLEETKSYYLNVKNILTFL